MDQNFAAPFRAMGTLMPENDLIIVETPEPGIALLTLNRPDKLNALSSPLLAAFDAALERLAADHSVRVIIVTGAGGKAFVAGADIAEYREPAPDRFAAYQFESRRIFDRLEALPKPTIAAVRGYALGGGLEIALCCDVMVCGQSARLGLPEALLGLSPGGGGTQRLVRLVGRQVAADMLLGAQRISGERAMALGIAAAVVPDDELIEACMARARAMLKAGPLAQAEIKRLLRQGADAPLPVAQSLEQEVLLRLYGSADAAEGIAAFLDKRQPQFQGE